MKKILFYLFVFTAGYFACGQGSFELPAGTDKLAIPFEKINNLIVLPVNVNGSDLKLILDTGASRTIIFNTYGVDSLKFSKGQKLKISGYGEREPFDVFFSKDNELNLLGYSLKNAELLTMVDQNIDLSGFFGIDINGLIGYDFFQDHIIEIDYLKDIVFIYEHNSSIRKKLRRMKRLPITIEGRKPYVETVVQHNNVKITMNTLLDTGNGDALWLLPPFDNSITPKNGFIDNLGIGMSGNVEGLRSKINHAYIGDYKLNKVTVSIPQEESLANRRNEEDSTDQNRGSIGGDILSRFKVVFDYKNRSLYLRSRPDLDEGFYYNMSGIEVMEGDLEVFRAYDYKALKQKDEFGYNATGNKVSIRPEQRSFKIAPKLLVSYVRPGSLADQAGLKEGDVIIKFNNRSRNELSRGKVVSRFFQNPYSYLRFTVRRNEKILKFKIQLIPLL